MKVHYRHLFWPFLFLAKQKVNISASNVTSSRLDEHGKTTQEDPHPHIVDVYSLSKDLENGDPGLIHTTLTLNNETGVSRSLSPYSAKIGDFFPLTCNSELDSATCTNLSDEWDGSGALTVPCGECYTYDYGPGDRTITGGIRVIGKLVFPADLRNAVITTPSVIVEGKLQIRSDATTVGAPLDKSVVFKITGKSNVKFVATDENRDACPGSSKECNLGRKPFVVAGGQLDIDAIPSGDCTSHTPILDTIHADLTPDDTLFDKYEPFLNTCTSNVDDSTFIRYDFDDGLYGNWTGWWGGYVQIENNALRVTNREIQQQGPYLDFTKTKPGLCLVPGQEYLLSVRIKLDKADGTLDGEPTTCKTSGGDDHCPQFGTKFQMLDGTSINRWKARMNQYDVPNYGEWGDWHDIITFAEDELDPTNPYSVLYIDRVDPGVDISIDNFRLSNPTELAYPDPADVCGELIVNGGAEADDMNPFPMKTTSSSSPIFVKNENGNNYFHQPNRVDSGSSIDSYLNVECLEQGATYQASVKVRIRSEFDQQFYFYFRYLNPGTENDWSSHRYLECPPQRWSDGWVTCSGKFTVNELLANSEQVKARMYFSGSRNIDIDVDYDDFSIQYLKGRVDKLVVDADDAQCWAEGADVHIGSSVYYSSESESRVPNGYNTLISDITSNGNNLELTLADSPFIPIVTVTEDEDYAAEVALLSRNVKIESDTDELENKGAYLQVLHTPNTAQIIKGVEFENMGRGGELDRYPVHFLYSGSIDGTEISWSSIHGSNLRCITIEGTGNVTVSLNVAYKNKGHCIYLGYESQDNSIERNFVSDTNSVSSSDKVDNDNDSDPGAFRNRYNPNHYTSNIAVASRAVGFHFEYASETLYEDHTSGAPNPRQIAMGEFTGNKAKSNGGYGMKFNYLEQSEKIYISDALTIKNRYYGLYVYQGARLTIQNSLIADNFYGIDLRWADEAKITDTNIRGISQATKDLTHPPYFRDPCKLTGSYVPFGYRMQTAILRWDGFYPDGVTPRLNKGSDLTNVEFSEFDHTDECSESVPIIFNTHDMRDGHWDYSSSFTNVGFDGTKIMDAKGASENGVSDIVITDSDGSSDPSGVTPRSIFSSAGTFMSNKRYLMAFAGGDCAIYWEGIVYCQNTCYRTVQLQVDQTGTSDFDLKVTNENGVQVYIPGTMRYEDDIHRSMYENNYRRFSASLPSGNYELEFFQDGHAVWPKYAYEIWEPAPPCSGYVSSVDVSVVEPPLDIGECDELTENSDAENGLVSWLHRNDNDVDRGYLASLGGAGIGGSTAIGYFDRYRSYHGIGQNLDTRCLHQKLNSFYELKAWFRLEEDGNSVECDRFTTSASTRCPKFVLKNLRYLDENKEEVDWDYDGLYLSHGIATSNPADEFNLLHGVLKVNEKYNSVHRAFLYLSDFATKFDLIVDNFTVTDMKVEGECSGNYVRNGDLATRDSRFWKPHSTAQYDVVSDGDTNVLTVYGRGSADHGIRQDLHIDSNCFREKDRIQIRVRYQIQDSNGSPLICDKTVSDGLNECAYMRLRAEDSNGVSNSFPYIAETGAAHVNVESDEWAIMSGIYDLGSVEANHESMYLMIAGPHQDNTIVIDSVNVEPLEKTCDQILVNPSFSDGTSSFWSKSNTPVEISIYSPGADDDYSLYFEHPANTGHTILQELDNRCIVEGQQFVLSAKLKLLDANNGQALSCDPSLRSTSNENHCPVLRLRGEQCDNDFHAVLWNEKQVSWDANAFNDYEVDITVDANMASCDKITVRIGHYLPISRALLIDNVHFSQKTTFAPTSSPTISPTVPEEVGPTVSPTVMTDAPTTSLTVFCPPVGEVIKLNAGSVMLGIAESGSVCNVIKVVPNDEKIVNVPMARSYDSNDWERAAGKIASSTFSEEFLCYEGGCQINLPPLTGGTEYHLISRTYSLSLRDEYARFLETASYGSRSEDLDDLVAQTTGENGSMSVIANFLQSQMEIPMTSHREYWRTQANPRASFPLKSGKPDHPCDAMSRWREVTFVRNDYREWMPRILNVVGEGGAGPYRLYLDGDLRTVVDDFWLEKDETYSFNPEFDYQICESNWNTLDVVGGDLYIQLETEECVQAENPRVDITGYESEIPIDYILDLSNVVLEPIDEKLSDGGDYILLEGLNDVKCDNIPAVPNGPIFGQLSNGNWLQFDPRIDLKTNTPSSPLEDGGKSTELASGGVSYCSNVPRTFLNEDGCILSSDACRPSVSTEVDILLEADNIKALYNLTNRYVYGMTGLHVVDQGDDENDFPWKLPHPCTKSLRSRWLRKDSTACEPTDIYPDTQETLAELLSDESDTNPFIRDIYFPESGKTENGLKCNSTDTDPEIQLIVDDQCWERVHDDHYSVYDMTYWVAKHPGGPYHIRKWAEQNRAFIQFPNGYETNNHPMYRWHDNFHKFTYVGRYGDSVRLRDLPNDLRTQAVTDFFQDSVNINTSGVLVCGSPGEIASDKTSGFVFDIHNRLDFKTGNTRTSDDKDVVWLMTSLTSIDQLRQRVSWALAQILVVVKEAIREPEINESFLQYYDIFLRNAFGNYRDILKEISYAPLMAENLSFLMSRSSAYVWERYRIKAQADENFAREIMQLFSMGIVKLNLDGSPKLDENGNTVLAYTNDDIMSLSRAWTGFNWQPVRGNTESWNNRIDPMSIEASWRDKFPKSDTTGGYIGDYYPLCEDLPERAFLKKGATFRFLGSSVLPELMSDPFEFETDGSVKRMILDASSQLRNELCNKDDSNNCRFSNTVVLSSTKMCLGMECLVDTVRVVQVSPDAFYEYVRTPCVHQSFYNNGKKISPHRQGYNVMCGNPVLPEASEACCPFGSVTASRNLKYDGERMTLASAESRCEEISSSICSFYQVQENDYHKKSNYFWTSETCTINVKINSDGLLTIIHQPAVDTNKVLHVDDNNDNLFRVYWQDGSYPIAANECDGTCEVVNGDSCLCRTSVQKTYGFRSAPESVEEMLDKLFIGFPDPNIVDPDNYSSSYDEQSGITTYLKNGVFDSDTVFEYSDAKGRHFFVKNSVETVQVLGIDSGYTGYSFRNAPSFMSFVPSEAAVRDAEFETEATLDHYFYHDNTAPFLCLRLIQRLTSSNPSPRYVIAVVNAFITGIYEEGDKSFGNGKYGDMAATFAAIYLDREARAIALMGDPSSGSLREPILKVMTVLRSMKFTSTYPYIPFAMSNMKEAIGQAPHQFDTVFSFFLPEFEPYGPVGDASLVSPEGTMLDMPRIIGILNGLFSLARYGLTYGESGFGLFRDGRGLYLPSQYGMLTYGRTPNDAEFSFETFEGPSLVGGFDNIWSGRHYSSYIGEAVEDPLDPSNHVYRAENANRPGFFSQRVTLPQNTVVKFQFLASEVDTGATIGYSNDELDDGTWVFSDYSRHTDDPPYLMVSNNEWISCQFEVPLEQFRIVLAKRRDVGESYFDNIQIGQGSGTFCVGVDIEDKTPPGQQGYSGAVVDELATLLTSGRLSTEHRELIRNAYDNAGHSNDGLRIAQEMIFTSAEFHTTNAVKTSDQHRDSYSFPQPTGKPYKALVYVMFAGGCDSFNMLVPHTCPGDQDMYQQYLDIRGQVALSRSDLLPINTVGQTCSKYGVHPDLPAIRGLYEDNDLLFFANTGVMSQAVDKSNYNLLTNTQLFAHNHMQKETKRVDPYQTATGTGIFGRVGDVLSNRGHNVGSFSVNTFSVAVSGDAAITGSPTIVNDNGVPPIYLNDIGESIYSLHNTTTSDSGYFGEMWSSSLINSLDVNKLLGNELEGIETNTTFPDTSLGRKFETVARLMETREQRGVDVDTFYLEIGGFDTHADVEENLSERFIEVNAAIDAFVTELRHMEIFDDVTTIQTSDFARTLSPNSGDGTDHAWGGNYMMFGGAVAGGKIVGKYPDDITSESPINVGRGRLIPTTPWDAVFSTIATWLGVPNSSLDEVLPNLHNFDPSFLIEPLDVFESIPDIVPTESPTTSSPTLNPSHQPSSVTKSPAPSASPSTSPSANPNASPSSAPSSAPSHKPSSGPSIKPSASGTTMPTFAPICFDDESYGYRGTASKSCADWVSKNIADRCIKKDSVTGWYVFEHCRQTCERCKCQNNDFYYKDSTKTCSWVKKWKKGRCDLHPSIREHHCKSACDEPCCKDDPTYEHLGDPLKTCAWAKKRPWRCKTGKMHYYCPSACSSKQLSGGCGYDPYATAP